MTDPTPLPRVLTVMDAVEARHAPEVPIRVAQLVAEVEAAYAAQGLKRPTQLIETVVTEHLKGTPALARPEVAPFAFGWDRPAEGADWNARQVRVATREQRLDGLIGGLGTVGFVGFMVSLFTTLPPWLAFLDHRWWWAGGVTAVCVGLGAWSDHLAEVRRTLEALPKLGVKRQRRWQASPRAQAYLAACRAQPEVPLLRQDGWELDALAEADATLQRSQAHLQRTQARGPQA